MAKIQKKKTAAKTSSARPRKKRRGLRFFLSLLILIGAAGAVFWFGWVQFRIGEGQVGVIYTKSHGYEDRPLVNGEFEWRWQALLPTNMTLHIFNLETRSIVMSRKGTLPSGDLFAAMAGEEVDFNWDVEVRLNYRVRPEALPSLVAEGAVTSGIDSMYAEYESRIEGELSRILSDPAFSNPDLTPEQLISGIESDLESRGSSLDDRFEVLDVVLLDWMIPDMELYAESRRLYLEYMGLRQAVLTEVEDNAVRREDLQGARLDLLERYGRILSDYPVLLDLFALDGSPGASLLPPADLE